MAFDTTQYLDWYIPRVRSDDGTINLHSSGMPPLDLEALLGALPGGNPWHWAAAFETELARWLGHPTGEVLYTPGGTGGTLLALLALGGAAQGRGSGFLVEQPIYEPMLRQAERLGPVQRLVRRPEDRWGIDLVAAERALGPDIGVVLITEPHNPSGVYAPREQILELAALAEARGAWVLVNEVYRGFGPRESLHGAAPNLLVVSSLSKLFGTYAARLGWLSGPPEALARCRHAHLNLGAPSAPGAAVGLQVLARADALLAEARRRAARLSVVDAWVQQTSGVSWVRPEGTGYGCLALPAGTDDRAFAERLNARHGVLVIPGALWEQPGSVRLSWLQAEEEALATGLSRLGEALSQPTKGDS